MNRATEGLKREDKTAFHKGITVVGFLLTHFNTPLAPIAVGIGFRL